MLVDPHDPAYAAATQPRTSSVEQHPARVAVIRSPEDIPAAMTEVAALSAETGRPLRAMPQATGHGAGAPVDDGVVLLDTSGLADVVIDAAACVAVVGAGATWSQVNAAAERHGLMGLAGSSPSVGVSGYAFGGGVGWLVRRDGLASGSLRAVGYVDGDGRSRVARDDAEEAVDRDAMWAFRGAGGVGIAHTLEFDLVPVPALHAGALLWPAEHLPALVAAWSRHVGAHGVLGASVSSSISVLRVPPSPAFPEAVRGRAAVHLAVADPDGSDAALPLLDAMRAVAAPVMDTWGPTDAAGLARIHLDPPAAAPAIGAARWLDASTPDIAAELLAEALRDDAAMVLVEIRHVAGGPAPARDGAVVAPPGAFIAHAVGSLDLFPRERINTSLDRIRAVWSRADAGTTPGSWVEGSDRVPDALAPDVRARAAGIANAVDPHKRIQRSRLLA